MKTGTKSLLFGVHQFIWHPLTVYLAWCKLYGKLPNWKETICIIIHDWGYWGLDNMDDAAGQKHPEFAAKIAHVLLDPDGLENYFVGSEYFYLCLYHSRHYARADNTEPSKLCWADKASIIFDPWWLYLPRAWLSGELTEYRENCHHLLDKSRPHREFYRFIKAYFIKLAESRQGDAVSYFPETETQNKVKP
jgi:hypothetical protein